MTAFQQLVSDYKDQVYNTSLGMVRNVEDAEDITQEVFIEVYLKGSQFRGESSIRTWLYRLTINKCLEYLRSKKAQKRSGKMVTLDPQMELAGFDHPGIQLENKELANVLFTMLDKLPEHQRIAFMLHKVENLSHEEISAVMDKSTSSVESLIHRAKENLRIHLKSYYEKYRE